MAVVPLAKRTEPLHFVHELSLANKGQRGCSSAARKSENNNTNTIPMNTQNRSNKGFTLVEIMIVVVIIGLLAAMAIPAFQKVRQSSQDKAVLNNARQLSAAADQYYLENGVSSVASTALVGATNYVKAINTVANETYPAGYTQGVTITITGVAGSRTITYAP
jgi:type IV pilus assembly protein PilA